MARSLRHGVEVGVSVTDIYYAVPEYYTAGERFDVRSDAIRTAIRRVEKAREVSEYVPERVTVDERWTFSTGLDTVMHRETFNTLAEAYAMLAAAEKFGG